MKNRQILLDINIESSNKGFVVIPKEINLKEVTYWLVSKEVVNLPYRAIHQKGSLIIDPLHDMTFKDNILTIRMENITSCKLLIESSKGFHCELCNSEISNFYKYCPMCGTSLYPSNK